MGSDGCIAYLGSAQCMKREIKIISPHTYTVRRYGGMSSSSSSSSTLRQLLSQLSPSELVNGLLRFSERTAQDSALFQHFSMERVTCTWPNSADVTGSIGSFLDFQSLTTFSCSNKLIRDALDQSKTLEFMDCSVTLNERTRRRYKHRLNVTACPKKKDLWSRVTGRTIIYLSGHFQVKDIPETMRPQIICYDYRAPLSCCNKLDAFVPEAVELRAALPSVTRLETDVRGGMDFSEWGRLRYLDITALRIPATFRAPTELTHLDIGAFFTEVDDEVLHTLLNSSLRNLYASPSVCSQLLKRIKGSRLSDHLCAMGILKQWQNVDWDSTPNLLLIRLSLKDPKNGGEPLSLGSSMQELLIDVHDTPKDVSVLLNSIRNVRRLTILLTTTNRSTFREWLKWLCSSALRTLHHRISFQLNTLPKVILYGAHEEGEMSLRCLRKLVKGSELLLRDPGFVN